MVKIRWKLDFGDLMSYSWNKTMFYDITYDSLLQLCQVVCRDDLFELHLKFHLGINY